jgi:IS30 family transposase
MKSYKHLQEGDRNVIEKLLRKGKSKRYIARILDIDASTISRETRRNKSGGYYARSATQIAKRRRKKAKKKKIFEFKLLNEYVTSKLKIGWSPEEISGRLKIEYSEEKKIRISHESIYLWIYEEKERGNLELYKYLERSHKQRQKRGNSRKQRALKSVIKGKRSIHDRPEEANSRMHIGHWEGDTLEGSGKDGHISTFVDRKSRYLVGQKMDNKKAESLCRSAFEGFGELSNDRIATMTFDNGTEFAEFKSLEEAFECDIYFADPYSAWQRGTNEYTNRLLRRFFPKKMSFKNLQQKDIDYAVYLLNNRPRKCLNYFTPYEIFFAQDVALQS